MYDFVTSLELLGPKYSHKNIENIGHVDQPEIPGASKSAELMVVGTLPCSRDIAKQRDHEGPALTPLHHLPPSPPQESTVQPLSLKAQTTSRPGHLRAPWSWRVLLECWLYWFLGPSWERVLGMALAKLQTSIQGFKGNAD